MFETTETIKSQWDNPDHFTSDSYDEWFSHADKSNDMSKYAKAFGYVDNTVFSEDEASMMTSLVHYVFYDSALVLAHGRITPNGKRYLDPYRFTILTTHQSMILHDREFTIGGCDRTLRFKLWYRNSIVENGMIKTEIQISKMLGLKWKDFDVWNEYTLKEKHPEIECKGFNQLKKEFQHNCKKNTVDVSGYCEWCFRALVSEEFDDDHEPDYDETDWAAEDEALYYQRLDDDIAIANGELPL